MKKLTTVLLAVGMLGAAACKSEVDDKPAAAVTEAPAAAEKPEKPADENTAPAAQNLKEVPLDATATKVEWVAAKVTKDHKGGFEAVTGKARYDASGALVGIDAEIDTRSVTSDTEKLTKHLKSPDFFDVEKFPKATFTTTKIEPGGEGGTHTVTGVLDLHGVKKEISFPATIKTENGVTTATSEFTLKRFDFGINYKGAADDLIKDEVLMKLHVVAPAPEQT